MNDRNSKLRLGGFVAGGLSAIGGMILLFGGAPTFFDRRTGYTVTFAEAPNVAVGTPVRKSGVRIGQVSGIALDPETGQVRVRILVDKQYLPRQADDATISRGLLNGDTSIDFVPKSSAEGQQISAKLDVYVPETDIVGVTPFNPNRLVQQASGALPSAQESMARIVAAVARFEQVAPKIEKAFDEVGGLARSGRELVPELRKTNEKVQDVLAFNDAPGPDGEQKDGLKATLAEIRDFVRTAKPLIEDVRRVVAANEEDVRATVKSVRVTSEGVNQLLTADNRKALGNTLKNLEVASEDLTRAIRLTALVLDAGEKSLKEINGRLAQAGKT
ncbi:MAG: MlaD family protein, partial [Gemmataceae bacterium]